MYIITVFYLIFTGVFKGNHNDPGILPPPTPHSIYIVTPCNITSHLLILTSNCQVFEMLAGNKGLLTKCLWNKLKEATCHTCLYKFCSLVSEHVHIQIPVDCSQCTSVLHIKTFHSVNLLSDKAVIFLALEQAWRNC